MEMEKTKEVKYLDEKGEPTLTGELVRIINPPEGADINHEKHMFGKPFILKKGESKKVDRVVAESAVKMWQFLKLQKLALEDNGYDARISETNSLPSGYKFPEYDEVENSKLDYEAYQFHILQALANKVKVKGAMLCKKEGLLKKLGEIPTFDLLKGLKELKVPANFINSNILDNE